MHMSEADLESFAVEEKIWCATLGPDCVYVPAACIVAERLSAEDNVGIKMSFIDPSNVRGLRSMRQEQLDAMRSVPVLDEFFAFLDLQAWLTLMPLSFVMCLQ